MPIQITKPFMETRASKGIVKDYNQPNQKFGVQPPNDYKVMEMMWKKDEVIATAFDTTVDMVTRNGWDFIARTNNETLSKTERNKIISQFEELNFSEVIDNILYQMISYGDAFLELRRKDGTKITEIHPLETTEMRIHYDKHGNIQSYSQIPSVASTIQYNRAGVQVPGQVVFPKENIIHFRMKWVGSKVYSETPLEPIGRIWATKQNAFNYLDQMFMNLHPELFIHLKGANKEQYEAAREIIFRAKTQPGKPIITYGAENSATEIKETAANFTNSNGIFSVLEYLREAALMITRVPPVWIGLVNNDGANRGNSEAQIYSFETRIKKIQQKIQNKINMELLPALGYQHVEFNFNPITYKDEEKAFQNAAILKSIQVKPEGIIKYLKRNGITDIAIEDFMTQEEMLALQVEASNQTATNKTAPSRQGADKMQMKSKVGQMGTSDAGGKKIEQKNMQMRSTSSFANPSHWSWTIEGEE